MKADRIVKDLQPMKNDIKRIGINCLTDEMNGLVNLEVVVNFKDYEKDFKFYKFGQFGSVEARIQQRELFDYLTIWFPFITEMYRDFK